MLVTQKDYFILFHLVEKKVVLNRSTKNIQGNVRTVTCPCKRGGSKVICVLGGGKHERIVEK